MSYLTVHQVAEEAQRHPKTVEKALRAGRLHGVQQSGKNSTWRVKQTCFEAWIEGRVCEHKKNVSKLDTRRAARA